MTGSLIPVAIDKLVALLAGNSFQVFDGPGASDDQIPSALFIGWSDPDSLDYDEAAITNLSWPWLGHLQQAETAQIVCAAEAWNGNADQKAARDTVFATVDAIGTLIEGDPSLGLQAVPVAGINNLQVMGIKNLQLLQNQTDGGAFARLQFAIEIQGRVR